MKKALFLLALIHTLTTTAHSIEVAHQIQTTVADTKPDYQQSSDENSHMHQQTDTAKQKESESEKKWRRKIKYMMQGTILGITAAISAALISIKMFPEWYENVKKDLIKQWIEHKKQQIIKYLPSFLQPRSQSQSHKQQDTQQHTTQENMLDILATMPLS